MAISSVAINSQANGYEIIGRKRSKNNGIKRAKNIPELAYGDGIHDVAAKAVIQAAEDLVKILAQLKGGKDFPGQKQRSNGKLFVGKDWRPQHPRLIYNTFNDDLVDTILTVDWVRVNLL